MSEFFRSGSRVLFVTALLSLAGQIGLHAQEASPTPTPAEATLAAGAARLRAGDAEGAAQILEQVVAKDPSNGRAWRTLGAAQQQRKQFDRAIEAWRKSLDVDPTVVTPYFSIGLAYAAKADMDRSFEWLEKAKATRKIDMTQMEGAAEISALKADKRFAGLLPTPKDFADPFVEPTRVLREWDGEAAHDQFGWIARNIGDVDGDGIPDIVTSAPTNSGGGKNAGRIYVYSTKTGKLLWSADGNAGDQLGSGVEGVGDTNHDGIPDVIAGAPYGGYAKVYSGRDGRVLLTLTGENKNDAFGQHAAGAGDVDHDGFTDVIVGAPGNNAGGERAGRAYVYSGKTGATLLTLTGAHAGDSFGSAVAGFADKANTFLLVGAPQAGANHGGQTTVYRGLDSKPAFTIDSDETGGALGGMFLSIPGDVDGDGTPDVYASDWQNGAKGPGTGRIYVHSGRDGKRLLTLTGETPGEGFGTSPSVAGDVDGDGHADLIVGAWQYAGAAIGGGRAYLYSGKDGHLIRTYTCKTPGDAFGFDAVTMGDIDGDGMSDFLITSAWSAVHGYHSGRMFIVSSGVKRGGSAMGSKSSDAASDPVGGWGLDFNDRDPKVKAGDNFYMSQNGGWFARTELTPQQPRAAYWLQLRQLAPQRLMTLVKHAAVDRTLPPDSGEAKAGAFYRAFMDEKTIEAKGVTPLDAELKAIQAADTKEKMASLMGLAAGPRTPQTVKALRQLPDLALFGLSIRRDQQEPGRYIAAIGQGGLGLPGPEYYSDPKLADIKAAYEAYATRLLTMIGWPDGALMAKEIVALESRIAAASWTHEQMQYANNTYNPMTVKELAAFAPGIDWNAFLSGAGLRDVQRVVIDAKTAFPRLAIIFAETPLPVLRARLAFLIADDAAPNLNAAMASANFDFRFRMFNNQVATQPAREARLSPVLEACIGSILGEMYVSRHFSPESKTMALDIAGNLRKALDTRLADAAWLTAESKKQAREKLARMKLNIGYPERLPDHRELQIVDDDLYGDVIRAHAFNWRVQTRRLDAVSGASTLASDWMFTPQSVNYGYANATNTVEIPAATLQPPFFDAHADAALNYGAIGSLLGSQMVAAFDNQGRRYDADGRLRAWLTPEESIRIENLTKAVAAQYSTVEPLPGVHVKGELVANEAFDDLGGVQLAIDAYRLSLNGGHAPVLDGTTGDQRVFLGRAQMWRAKFDSAFVRNQIATGSNSPPFLRVNGPVRNLDAWYETFGIQPGDTMYVEPKERVRIW